jgi:hypothetical protein
MEHRKFNNSNFLGQLQFEGKNSVVFYLVGIYVVWAEGKTRLLLNVKVDRVSDT